MYHLLEESSSKSYTHYTEVKIRKPYKPLTLPLYFDNFLQGS